MISGGRSVTIIKKLNMYIIENLELKLFHIYVNL